MDIVASDLPGAGIEAKQSAVGGQPQDSGVVLAHVDDSKSNAAGQVALDAIVSKLLRDRVKPLQELVASYPKYAGMIFE
jgi:hypothetical protein